MTEPTEATVTIPRWLLVALIDCHEAASPNLTPICGYVAEARRILAASATGTKTDA